MIYKLFGKRFIDIILSIIGIIITTPVLIIVATAIKFDSKGPVLFCQDRIGLNGRVFKILKFRSMSLNAEKSGVYEQKNDPRVTRVGKIIRKTSVDELPQFINILKGDMSLIGPRPTLTYHPWRFDQYSEEQKIRFQVRPGVTGLAQINGRKELMWEDRIVLDVQYVKNLSITLDIKIFFKTLKKIITMDNNVNTGRTA